MIDQQCPRRCGTAAARGQQPTTAYLTKSARPPAHPPTHHPPTHLHQFGHHGLLSRPRLLQVGHLLRKALAQREGAGRGGRGVPRAAPVRQVQQQQAGGLLSKACRSWHRTRGACGSRGAGSGVGACQQVQKHNSRPSLQQGLAALAATLPSPPLHPWPRAVALLAPSPPHTSAHRLPPPTRPPAAAAAGRPSAPRPRQRTAVPPGWRAGQYSTASRAGRGGAAPAPPAAAPRSAAAGRRRRARRAGAPLTAGLAPGCAAGSGSRDQSPTSGRAPRATCAGQGRGSRCMFITESGNKMSGRGAEIKGCQSSCSQQALLLQNNALLRLRPPCLLPAHAQWNRTRTHAHKNHPPVKAERPEVVCAGGCPLVAVCQGSGLAVHGWQVHAGLWGGGGGRRGRGRRQRGVLC